MGNIFNYFCMQCLAHLLCSLQRTCRQTGIISKTESKGFLLLYHKQFLDETLLENEERRAKKRQELREEYAKNQALHQTLTGDTVDEKPVHQSTIEAELVTNEIQQQLPPSPVSVSVISSQQVRQFQE